MSRGDAAVPPPPRAGQEYVIGVLKAPVEVGNETFQAIVSAAADTLGATLQQGHAGGVVRLIDVHNAHVLPVSGAYSALDFMQVGRGERFAWGADLLLVVTDAELAGSKSYTLATPSGTACVGVVSTRRLNPIFWGEKREGDWAENQIAKETAAKRLVALLLHTLGHLLGLPHHPEAANVMHDVGDVRDLDRMVEITAEQVLALRRRLPGAPMAWPAVRRANPFRLLAMTPQALGASLAATLVVTLLWGTRVAAPASGLPASGPPGGRLALVAALALASLVVSAGALYRAFALPALSGRGRAASRARDSVRAVALLSATLVALLLGLICFDVAYVGLLLFVPPATSLEALGGSAVAASVGVLSGALAGGCDVGAGVKRVLLLDEET